MKGLGVKGLGGLGAGLDEERVKVQLCELLFGVVCF